MARQIQPSNILAKGLLEESSEKVVEFALAFEITESFEENRAFETHS